MWLRARQWRAGCATAASREIVAAWLARLFSDPPPLAITAPTPCLPPPPHKVCVETMMHLTCTNMPVEKLEQALKEVRGGASARGGGQGLRGMARD